MTTDVPPSPHEAIPSASAPMLTQPIFTQRFTDAFAFAATAHATQMRKGTHIPYASHLMAVASLTLEVGGDEDVAIAALLHDAVEGQGGRPMLDRIRERFGDRVADIVAGCTDTFENPKPLYAKRKREYIEHLKQAAIDTCVAAAADKLHNARTIHADLRTEGARVWGRFKADSATQHRFYREVADVLHARLAGHPAQAMVDELLREVAAIWPSTAQAEDRLGRKACGDDAVRAIQRRRG